MKRDIVEHAQIKMGRGPKQEGDKQLMVSMYKTPEQFTYIIAKDDKEEVVLSFIICPHDKLGNEGADYIDFCADCYEERMRELIEDKISREKN